jgi:hypothetical protein
LVEVEGDNTNILVAMMVMAGLADQAVAGADSLNRAALEPLERETRAALEPTPITKWIWVVVEEEVLR